MAMSSRTDHHYQHHLDQIADGKPLQSIKTKTKTKIKDGAGGTVVARRSVHKILSREMSVMSNSCVDLEGGYHALEAAAVPFVWESAPGTPKHHIICCNQYCSSYNTNPDHHHHHHHHLSIPPLTPPPSYRYSNSSNTHTNGKHPTSSKKNKFDKTQNHPNITLIQSLLSPRLSLKKDRPQSHSLVAHPAAPSSPASSASASSPPSPLSSSRKSSSSSSSSSSSTSTRPARSVPSSSTSTRPARSVPSSSSSSSSPAINTLSSTPRTRNHELSFDAKVQAEDTNNTIRSPDSTLCFSSASCSNARFRACYSTLFKLLHLRGRHHLA